MSMDAPYDPNPPAYTPPPLTGPPPMDPAPTYAAAAVAYAPPGYTPPSYAPPAPAWAPPPAVYIAPPPVKLERFADELIVPAGYELATARRRVASYFLSLVLVVVTLGIGYAVWGVLAWRKGRTPTQQILHLRTERMGDRGSAGWGRMAVREIVGRFVELLVPPVVAIISLVMMLTRTDRRTIHDLIAGTAVIHELRRTPPAPEPPPVQPAMAEPADAPEVPAVAEPAEAPEVPAVAAEDLRSADDATTDSPA